MSKCKEIRSLIEKKMSEPLNMIDDKMLSDHVKQCSGCDKYYKKTISLSGSLRSFAKNKPSLPDEFFADVSLKINQRKSRKNAFTFFPQFRPAFAVFLFIFVMSGIYFFTGMEKSEKEEQPEIIAKTEVESGEPVSISLNYDALDDVDDVTFTISLGENISFHSSNKTIANLQKHVWKGNLKKGINTIPFVVNASKMGTWQVDTRADFEGLSYKHRIMITVGKEKTEVVYLKFPDEKLRSAI